MITKAAVARVAAVVAVAVVSAIGGGAPARAAVPAQAGASTAVVIVDTGVGVQQSVIHFDGSVSGIGALRLAGANPETIDYGGTLGQAVCKLYGVGDAQVPSQCPGGWVYYRAVGGAGGWTQSSLGVSNTSVHDGDVEGWRYGGGAPPFASFCAVVGCGPPPTVQPSPTQAPSAASPPTAAPSGAAPAVNGTTSGTKGGSKPDSGSGNAEGGSSSSSATANGDSPPSTTGTAGRRASDTGRHRRIGSVEVAAAGTGGGTGGGSPVGVIVALAVVAAGVVGGLWLRRRRRGPAPG